MTHDKHRVSAYLLISLSCLIFSSSRSDAQSLAIEWVSTGQPIPTPMSAMGHTVLDNQLYLGGGIQGGGCTPGARQYRWTPGVGWSATGALVNLPADACTFGAFHIGAGAGTGSGLVWYIGGWDACNTLNPGNSALSYNPVTNCFAQGCVPPLSRPCIGAGAGGYSYATLGSRIHLLGGISGFAFEHQHVIFNTTTRLRVSSPAAALPPGAPRAFGAAVALDGRVYYLGGQFDFGGQWIFLNPCDPPIAAGGTLGGCDVLCAFTTCGAFDCLTCPQCFSGGGACDPDAACTSRVDAYNPATNSWAMIAPMPGPLTGHSAVVLNDKIYVVGGVDSCLNYNTSVFVYSPVCDEWATIPSVPFGGRVQHSGAVLNDGSGDRIYMSGGIDAISGNCLTSHSFMRYTAATAANAPLCDITAPADAAIVCDCVDIDYTVADADTGMLNATWKYSTDGGISWNLCTDKALGANPRMVPNGSGTFQWDADTDVGMGPLSLIVTMCVSDGNEFGVDRVNLTVDCSMVGCCTMPGDCDGNFFIDILDVFAGAQSDAGMAILSAGGLANCNVHNTGVATVTILDSLTIANFIIGKVPTLDCCP